MSSLARVIVRSPYPAATEGTLFFGNESYACRLGRAGVTGAKREGDGATPLGLFPLRTVYFRSDRGPRPETALPVREIAADMGWSDDPADPAYNSEISLPSPFRHERLWRDDALYDLFCVMGYNDDPAKPGLGSAIFLHVAPPNGKPTQGCVALDPQALRRVLAACGPETLIAVEVENAGG